MGYFGFKTASRMADFLMAGSGLLLVSTLLRLLNSGLLQSLAAISLRNLERVQHPKWFAVKESSLFCDSWYPTKVIAGTPLIRRHIAKTKRIRNQSWLEKG